MNAPKVRAGSLVSLKTQSFILLRGKVHGNGGTGERVTAERGTVAGQAGPAQQGNGYGVNSATKKAKKFTTAPQKQ